MGNSILRMLRRGALLILVMPLAGGATAGLAAAPVAAATTAIGFETPSVVDPIHTNGEPDIGLDPQGRVFVSGPTGTGTQRSTWFGSIDGGHSYRVISPGPPPSAIAGIVDPPGGGDTDINFDRSGKQYFADLYALACLRTAVTSDGGATVAQQIYPAGCSGIPGADRQWLAVYDPPGGTISQSAYTGPRPLIYMAYNNLVNGTQWTKSYDGLTYVGAPINPPTYAPFGADGYPAIDQLTGQVFQASGSGNSLLLNIGTPNKDGDLAFLDAPSANFPNGDSSKLIHIADNLKGSPNTLFTVLSMDSDRNLFVAFAISATSPADRQVFVSASSPTSGWMRWTKPVQVSKPPSLVNVFPWVKAGSAGRADAVWYGSDRLADPSSHSGQVWNAFLAQTVFPVDSLNHVTLEAPTTTQVKVSPHPMHYDDICLAGTDCIQSQGNRNLADFFVVNIDSTGAAEVVYDDTSNGLIQDGFEPAGTQIVDHAGAGVITVARQSSGMGVFGTAVSGPSNAPVSGLTHASGEARYPVIGGLPVPGFDLTDTRLSLSSGVLTVTSKVSDLAHPGATAAQIPGTNFLQYVTRWQMGNTIYYAAMEATPAGTRTFYAGRAKSVDLCSVSACFPHVITYPEPGLGGRQEAGRVDCPAAPGPASPCTLTIQVNAADVGGPTGSSLLEEVGSYGLASAAPSGSLTNAQAEADQVPLEIGGLCCFNFTAGMSAPSPCPETDGTGSFHNQDGDGSFQFDADACSGDGAPQGVSVKNGKGRSFTATIVNGVFYDAGANRLVLTGQGIDSGQSVTYTLTFLQAAGSPGFINLVLSNGLTIAGNVVSAVLEL
jgi:hypothetical protein